MKKILYFIVGLTALNAGLVHAQSGIYPYTGEYYEDVEVIETWQTNGVIFEEHHGVYLSGRDGDWNSDMLSFTAINTTKEPKCVRVTFTPYGNSLNWAGIWGSGNTFYLKKRQTLKYFAGITSKKENFGFESGLKMEAWTPLEDKNCAGPKKPSAPSAK